MSILIAGVVFWSIVHLFPSLAPAARAALIERLGQKAYRGLFALDIVIAIVLIVIGWRSAEVQPVYAPPLPGSFAVAALMLLSFVLFAAASAPGNIKRLVRHPMLTGVLVWGGAHLLANGDNRSIVLFGGMSAWALVSIVTISRRDGAWEKPAPVPASRDAMTIIASALVFAVVLWFHGTLFGQPALPGF